ncbi:unnamed protein product [Effrenium voratum]|uniref:Uncharacterized protein n=1 Tax=Effrenium voratum TaxID=2562239 RepID=A0AA36IM24_9DINO|nr:unnamed protein product [Effrenium voratum]
MKAQSRLKSSAQPLERSFILPLSEPSLKELHTRRAPLGLSTHKAQTSWFQEALCPFMPGCWKISKANCLLLCMFAALLASVLLRLIAAVRLLLLAFNPDKGCGLPSTLQETVQHT